MASLSKPRCSCSVPYVVIPIAMLLIISFYFILNIFSPWYCSVPHATNFSALLRLFTYREHILDYSIIYKYAEPVSLTP